MSYLVLLCADDVCAALVDEDNVVSSSVVSLCLFIVQLNANVNCWITSSITNFLLAGYLHQLRHPVSFTLSIR